MAETRVYFDTDVDISATEGAFVPFPPWLEFDGALFAAHQIGSGYAAFSPDDEAEAYGPLYDHSGQGHHLNSLNDLAAGLGQWGVTAAVVGVEANATYTLLQIWDAVVAAGQTGFSIIAAANVPAAAKTVALVRSSTDVADPNAGLTIAPQSQDMRVQRTGGGAAQTGSINNLTTELGNNAYYCGVYTLASGYGWSKRNGAATKAVDVPSNVAVTAMNANVPIEFGDEAGTGTGSTVLSGFCIILRPITQAEFEAAVENNLEYHAAIGSGLDA